MLKKVIATALSVAVLSTLLIGCGAKKPVENTQPTNTNVQKQVEKKVVRVATGMKAPHPLVPALQKFEKDFETATKDKYDVQIFEGNMLGDDAKVLEGLKGGTIETGIVYSGILPVDQLGIFDLPFLFPNYKSVDAVFDGPVGQKLLAKAETSELLPLALVESGYRMLSNSKKEVKTPADIAGLRIRTMQSDMHLNAWKSLGAVPTPMAFSKVYGEIKAGNLEGQENAITTIYSSKIHEVNPYITLTGHVYTRWAFLASKKLTSQMTPEEVQALKKAAQDANASYLKAIREEEKKNIEAIKAAGGKVTELTTEQRKAFEDATKGVYDQFADKVGKDLLNEVKAEIEKNK